MKQKNILQVLSNWWEPCLGCILVQQLFPLSYNKPDPFLYDGAGAACWSDPKLYAGPGGCDVI